MTGFGFPLKQSLLLQMSLGACQIILLVSSSLVATFVPSTRLLCMIFNTFVSLAGMTMVWKIDLNQPVARMAGLAMGVGYSVNIPLSLSIITSNVAGFSKKSVVSGLLFVAYCVGNIVGPQLFLSSEAPSYPVCYTNNSEATWQTCD
jgi:predicted membrane-bound spermidine synthase